MNVKYMLFSLSMISAVILAGCSADSQENSDGKLDVDRMDPDVNDDGMVVADNIKAGQMSNPDNGRYLLDADASTLEYGAYKITGSGHKGTVDLSSGYLVVEDGEFTAGEFIVDMTTITESTDSTGFITHVMSEDFFDVEDYPESKFVVNDIEYDSGDSYIITGDLTIMDTTDEISFPAEMEENDGDLIVNAEFTIDRTKWGIIYGSGSFFKEIGDNAIKDEIDYRLDLVFRV